MLDCLYLKSLQRANLLLKLIVLGFVILVQYFLQVLKRILVLRDLLLLLVKLVLILVMSSIDPFNIFLNSLKF